MQLFAVEVMLNEQRSNTATYLVFAESEIMAGTLAMKETGGAVSVHPYEVDPEIAARVNLEPNIPWLIIRNELGHIPRV